MVLGSQELSLPYFSMQFFSFYTHCCLDISFIGHEPVLASALGALMALIV